FGGWPEGDASYTGENPTGSAVITYYQRTRHLFGDLKIEVLDSDGKVLDTVPASKRRGLNRVTWAMRAKPPLVPPAASVAGFSTQGPRVVPGTYTVRMTKNRKVYETKLVVDLDRRADYTVQDRQVQFNEAQRVSGMFGQISGLIKRINQVRGSVEMSMEKAEGNAKLTLQLKTLSDKADEIRKKIVATKEGGDITGEERIRENLDNLFGVLIFYEGKPSQNVIARANELQREIDAALKEFEALESKDVPAVNRLLRGKDLPPIEVPPDGPLSENPLSSVEAERILGRALTGLGLR
ncbi:MAG: sialidase, partial [Acidobacteria bacterium]|nr:sialidase [Acidobacteriota bacterium]